MNTTPYDLEAENARLRERVDELERKLYPPPPPPKMPDDPIRYVLVPRELREYEDDPWVEVQRIFAESAIEYARERHPDLRWHYAYGWADIPEHGRYTTAGAVWDARNSEQDVVVYKIDDRTHALDAISAERKRLRDPEWELMTSLSGKSLVERRKIHYRLDILWQASRELDRPFHVACKPLADYSSVTRAASSIITRALAAAEADIRIEDVPGYLPNGCWECQSCGYPYPDSDVSEGATDAECGACHTGSSHAQQTWFELFEKLRGDGKHDRARELEEQWERHVERFATRA
jgi:hypothetical protein